jgi:hypothetical protein
MGTRYTVKKHTDRHNQKSRLYLDKHSNEFDIGVELSSGDGDVPEMRDLTFEDLRGIRDKINEILDYWDETEGE